MRAHSRAIRDHDIATAKSALLEQPQFSPLCEHGTSTAQRDWNDDELILIHQSGFAELRSYATAAE